MTALLIAGTAWALLSTSLALLSAGPSGRPTDATPPLSRRTRISSSPGTAHR